MAQLSRASVSLALVGVLLTVGAVASGSAPAQASLEAATTYQIIDGSMTYTTEATRSCAYGTGECHDYDGGYRQSSAQQVDRNRVQLAVFAPGAVVTADQFLSAPFRIAGWEHGHRYARAWSEGPCGPGQAIESDSGLTHDPRQPSYLNAAMTLTPRAGGLAAFDARLAPPQSTEPRFGWTFPLGLRWTDSSRYSTLTETSTQSWGGSVCTDTTSTTTRTSVDRAPFDPYPDAARTSTASASSTATSNCTATTCVVRVQGTTTWTYAPAYNGNALSGSGVVDWWFDVEVKGAGGEADSDGDGVPDSADNCVDVVNTNQADLDVDRIGDVCDPDIDGDGVDNDAERVAGTNPRSSDTDGDGIGDGRETDGGRRVDTDGDGSVDGVDLDSDGDGRSDRQEGIGDDDGDGIPNWRDADVQGSFRVSIVSGSYSTTRAEKKVLFAIGGTVLTISDGRGDVRLQRVDLEERLSVTVVPDESGIPASFPLCISFVGDPDIKNAVCQYQPASDEWDLVSGPSSLKKGIAATYVYRHIRSCSTGLQCGLRHTVAVFSTHGPITGYAYGAKETVSIAGTAPYVFEQSSSGLKAQGKAQAGRCTVNPSRCVIGTVGTR